MVEGINPMWLALFQCIQEGNANYMQAIIHETLRKSSSPIVPHVASVDSDIDGRKAR
jgi:hypothetical protein